MGCNCEGYRKGLSRDVGGIHQSTARSRIILVLLESWAILLTDVVRIREEILPWFQTLWCWNIRRRNSSIGSRKSRRHIVLSLKLSWRRIIKQSCKVSFRGAIAGFADDHDDVEQRLSNNDRYVYNFHSQFIFGCVFRRKETCLNTRDSDLYIMNSQSRICTAPAPARLTLAHTRPCQGLKGWPALALRRRTISVG